MLTEIVKRVNKAVIVLLFSASIFGCITRDNLVLPSQVTCDLFQAHEAILVLTKAIETYEKKTGSKINVRRIKIERDSNEKIWVVSFERVINDASQCKQVFIFDDGRVEIVNAM